MGRNRRRRRPPTARRGPARPTPRGPALPPPSDVGHHVVTEREMNAEVEDPRGGAQKSRLVGGDLNTVVGKEAGTKRLEEGLPGKEPHMGDVATVDGEAGTRIRSGVEELGGPAAEEDLDTTGSRVGEKKRKDHEAGGVEAGPKRAELEKRARVSRGRPGT